LTHIFRIKYEILLIVVTIYLELRSCVSCIKHDQK